MERPVPRARIGRRLEPAARRQDVVALVAVDVARADAVSVAAIADDVRHPRLVLDFVPGLAGAVLLRQDFLRLAVVVEIDEQRELDVEAFVDRRFLPDSPCPAARPCPGCATTRPSSRTRRPRRRLDSRPRRRRSGRSLKLSMYWLLKPSSRKRCFVQSGRLVPVLARDDVEPPVAVDVGDRGRLAGAQSRSAGS